MMKQLIENFNLQLKEALAIANSVKLKPAPNTIQNVLISGLGGSGIGGTVVAELLADTCAVPILVNKDYFVPEFINETSLVIISSYSGNTEETVLAMQKAIEKKAIIVCVTSGGTIETIANKHNFDIIKVPGGHPPRSCFGYSFVQLIKVLVHFNLAPSQLIADIFTAIELLEKEQAHIQLESKTVAEKLFHKIPVIYSLGSCEGVTVRFRQQINENSKMLCWHNVFPEMNHNELVGWTVKNDNLAVVTFHTNYDYERTKKRYDICKPVFEKHCCSVTDLYAKGKSKLEQYIYHIHLGDWISYYLGELNQVDIVEVRVIDHLKSELSKF